jgi:hypothetical protein
MYSASPLPRVLTFSNCSFSIFLEMTSALHVMFFYPSWSHWKGEVYTGKCIMPAHAGHVTYSGP